MSELENKNTEAATAYQAGLAAADLENRTLVFDADDLDAKIPVAIVNPGQTLRPLTKVIEIWESRADQPRRRKGTAQFFDLASFLAYVERMKSSHSVAWANPSDFYVKAVFDYHPAGGDPKLAGWGHHTAEYTCPRSPEWQFWLEKEDEGDMSQDEFAQLIEDRFEEIQGGDGFPNSAQLLEVARDLRVYSKATFERKVDPVTGQFSMVAKEDHEQHSTPIPRAFRLGLRIFDGGELYGVEARVRFRLVGGRPTFAFQLHRRTELERDAFGGIVAKVREQLPVFIGQSDI